MIDTEPRRGDDEVSDVPIFSLSCSNKTDPTKCLLYLGYGRAGDPNGGDVFTWLMTCYHCPFSSKVCHQAMDHRRKFGIKTGDDSRKLVEYFDIEPAVQLNELPV